MERDCGRHLIASIFREYFLKSEEEILGLENETYIMEWCWVTWIEEAIFEAKDYDILLIEGEILGEVISVFRFG